MQHLSVCHVLFKSVAKYITAQYFRILNFFQILPTVSTQKRKPTGSTLKEKKEMIDAAKKEPNQSKLAREIRKKWGIEVKRTTIKGILSKKDAIEAAIKAGIPSKRMKLKPAQNSKLDDWGSYG